MNQPNDYTRQDVIKLARIIDPISWAVFRRHAQRLNHGLMLTFGQNPDHLKKSKSKSYNKAVDALDKSITIASWVLAYGYRDCRLP